LLALLAEAFLLTAASESLVYLIVLRRPASRLVLSAVLINALTNPLANYAHLYLHAGQVPLEAAVVLCEGLLISLLFPTGLKQGIAVSLAANMLSAGLGLLVWAGE